MLDINLLRKDLDAVLAGLNARKSPQAFLDLAAFTALEAERKTIQTRTEELQAEWLDGKARVGLTAGASAPDVLVQAVITRLRAMGAVSLRTLDGVQEHTKFPLPKGLKADTLE